MYTKHIKPFCTRILYMVLNSEQPFKSSDDSVLGMSRCNIYVLSAVVTLTAPTYKEHFILVSTIISRYLKGMAAWDHIHKFKHDDRLMFFTLENKYLGK